MMNFSQLFLIALLFIVVACGILLFISVSRKNIGNYKLPEGPRGFPIIGNIPQFLKNPHLKFTKWRNDYGGIYTLYLGSTPAVVVSDVKLLKELFGLPQSTGKFSTDSYLLVSQGSYGIVGSEGKQWQEQRQFCLKKLKQFGFGRGSQLEPEILKEVDVLCEWIKNEGNASDSGVVLNGILNQATNNTFWTMVTGERVELTDSKIVHLLEEYITALQYTMKTGLGYFPWLKYIAPGLSGYTEFNRICRTIHEYVGSIFQQHRELLVMGTPPRDLIDAYLQKLEECSENQGSSFFGNLGRRNAVASVVELFIAGGDTTSTVLNWLIFYLAHYKHVQDNLQEEIAFVVGQDRQPSLDDRPRMPYAEAVILEALRFSSLAPQGLIQKLEDDVRFHDFVLPKGLLLIANLYGIHYDSKIWGDPDIFRPERFLGENGSKMKEYVVAFQPGRRTCIGEQMAKDLLFLFTTRLFQTFTVSPNRRFSKEMYFEADVGLILAPKPLGVMMETRVL